MNDIQDWHSRFADGIKWRLTNDGVEVFGDGIVKRTSGKPDTVKRIWNSFGKEISLYSAKYNIPVEIIIANIATESGGKTSAYREEPGYKSDILTPNKVSAGLMQTLVSTAMQSTNIKPMRARDLFGVDLSIHAGTSYIASQAFKTNLDPVLVPIAYNAGGIYYQNGVNNRFKMRQYPIGTSEHVDRYILWFNDTRHAIKTKYIDVGNSLTMGL